MMRLSRWLVGMLMRMLYRLRLRDVDAHVPASGPALLVCNHVSFLDALLLSTAVARPVRFVMHQRLFSLPVLRWVFRASRAIPIAGARTDPQLLRRAFDQIDAELAAGELVCIFPEGALTVNGAIAPFRQGMERVLARRPVPVVPLALRGMWGSMWSRRHQVAGGASRWLRLPSRFCARVEVVAGPPITGREASAAALEARVRELRGSAA